MQLTQALTLVPERKREEKDKTGTISVKELARFLDSPSRDVKTMEFAVPQMFEYHKEKAKDDNEVVYTMRGVLTDLTGKAEEEELSLIEKLVDIVVEKGVKRLGFFIARTIWGALWDLTKWLVETVVKGAIRNLLRWLIVPVLEAVVGFLMTPVGLALAVVGGALGGAYLIYKAFFSEEPQKPKFGEGFAGETAEGALPFGGTSVAGIPIAVPPGSVTPATDLAALLQKGESNVANPYGVVNIPAGRGRAAMQPLEQMTVSQVMAAQAAGQFNAAGRYQIIDSTLKGAVKALHLTGNELFDKNLQDRIFNEYLTGPSKRPRLYAYLSGKSNDVYAAAADAAQEWASVATPPGYKTRSGRVSDGTYAYYDNSRNNPPKAHISAAQMIATLQLERAKRLGNSATSTVVESRAITIAPEAMIPATSQGKIKAVSDAQHSGNTFMPPDKEKTIIKTQDGKLVAVNM